MKPLARIRSSLTFAQLAAAARALIFEPESPEVTSRFEAEFAARWGLPPGVVFPKARVAFYFLLQRLPLRPGGKVLISALHIADYVNMIRLAGFEPEVVDLQPGTNQIDYDQLQAKLGEDSSLFLITHLTGYPHDMDRIQRISQERAVPFIEDCSQALDSRYQGQRLGTFGAAAVFSLSLFKPVCTLMGGMVISKDTALLEQLRQEQQKLKSPLKWGLLPELIKNMVIKAAFDRAFGLVVFPLVRLLRPFGDWMAHFQKSNRTVELRSALPDSFLRRFGSAQAKMGLEQLKTLDQRMERFRLLGQQLRRRVEPLRRISVPKLSSEAQETLWLFPLICEDPAQLERFLAKQGVDSSRLLLSALAQEEAFADYGFQTPQAEHIKRSTLFVPLYPQLRDQDVERIAAALEAFEDKAP